MLDKLSAIDKPIRYLGMFEADNKQGCETVVESIRPLMQGTAGKTGCQRHAGGWR